MINILCYGDSNTYGYVPATMGDRYDTNTRWTALLKKALGENYNIIEEACNGRTTIYDYPTESWKNGLPYLKPCLHSHKPIDLIIVMLGTNDLKKFFGVNKDNISVGIEKIIEEIKDYYSTKKLPLPRIILAAPPILGDNMANSPLGEEYELSSIEVSKYFSKEYEKVAKDNDCIFFDAGLYTEPSFEDSIHITIDSHKRLAEEFYKLIKDINFSD